MARNKTLLTMGAALTAAVTICTIGTANADLAPTATDAVGIGSDTVQNIGNFLADGDNQGNTGYNSTSPKNRLVSFDATPDANDRTGYLNGSTSAALLPLNPTIVLRQGLQPVLRPNGSGAGVSALLLDGAHNIDYVRMSRLPSVADQNTATSTPGVGALRVIKISTDGLGLAVSAVTTLGGVSTGVPTNAPLGATALTAAQIVGIYKCSVGFTDWSSLGGTAGTIVPQIPQAGSGTRSTFVADLTALNGGVAFTLGSCVQTVEENDSTTLNNNKNAIAPFSQGRKGLFDLGYFNTPKAYGTPQTQLTSGVQFTATGTYFDVRNLYVVFRDSDKTAAAKFQPGGALNLVQELFYNPTNVGGVAPYVKGAAGQADIAAAGATPAYFDCGSGATVTTC